MNSQESLQDDEVLGEWIDEVACQIQAGKPVDVDAFLQGHPGREEELRELLTAIQVMADLGQSLSQEENVVPNRFRKGPESGTIGDYRILREVGRGGMGIVYEAEQLSLGRRVALKVLPFAATMDPRHLDRFRNEAQAAAQLHHNHIVPVFGVGQDRGVHYYAMQFIEGQTLAEVIFDLSRHAPPEDCPVEKNTEKPPDTKRSVISTLGYPIKNPDYFRKVAQLGIQAGEALEYAHQMGVIHRDIKPANLILDACGNLWVTDFGLANFQGNDARLTRTGDLLGTLRYMSPEQTSPKRLSMDPRSDIYSLGVTLYELLTLEPAFSSLDRAEVLVQVAHQEPRPPRSLNSAVPPELETIVLKAMAKNPDERYTSAQELTDDLHRFLDDQPIKARRPTLAQRWLKWTRRHKGLVRTVVAAAVVTMAALVVALFLVWNERNKSLAAYKDKDNAFQAEQTQRRQSEENVRLALQTLDQIYLSVVEHWSPRETGDQTKDRQLLEKALGFYELFARKNADNVEARKETARAYLRAGDVCTLLGQQTKAEDAYQKATLRYQELVKEFPTEPTYRQDLGRCFANLGALLEGSRNLDKAISLYNQAISQRRKLKDTFPKNKEYRQELADSHHRLANVFSAGDHIKEAEAAFAHAMGLQKQLVIDFPKDAKVQVALAGMHRDLAYMLWRNNPRLAEAARHLQEGQKFLEPGAIPLKGPPDVKYQAQLASLQDSFGTMFHEVGRGEEAQAAFRRAIQAWRRLSGEFPNVPHFQLEYAASQGHLGNLLRDLRRYPEAKEWCTEALTILEPMFKKNPSQPRIRDILADNLNNLAILSIEGGKAAEREKLFRRALALRQDLVKDFPDIPEYRRGLACAHHHLGILLRSLRRTDEAEKSYREAAYIMNMLIDEFPAAAGYGIRLVLVYRDLGELVHTKGNVANAEKLFRAALDQVESLLVGSPHMLPFENAKAEVLRDLGILLAATQRFAPAEKAFRESLTLDPRDTRTLNNLAWLLVTCPDTGMQNPTEALDLLRKAFIEGSRASCRWNRKACWNTLGVALYRAGEWQKARVALNRSMKINEGGTPTDWFFMAMTCRQLGEEKEALMWYRRANERRLAQHPKDEELHRFQKEAAQVLGLEL
jgi:serine/threonine protein kinase/Flp pilus assembly protein TadD